MRAIWGVLGLGGCFVTDAELTRALDRDGDGHLPVEAGGDDCDEGRPDIHPGADELCGDDVDNDCDGRIDDDGIGAYPFYRDADGDGVGVDEVVTACTEPEGYAPVSGDCDDGDPAFRPGIEDLCDGLDQDCDGQPDDDGLLILRFRDLDEDQWGDDADTRYACIEEAGWVNQGGDCDEADPLIHPGVEEVCDGVDDDCNGVADDTLAFLTQWEDLDGDGWGNEAIERVACEVPAGWATVFGDCDDLDPSTNPAALDLCDGFDQDCDSVIDDDAVFSVVFEDADGDGDGSPTGQFLEVCAPTPGFVYSSGDCDDTDPDVSSLATDFCDGQDNDCDLVVDDDAVFRLYFRDDDGDGVGRVDDTVEACAAPLGFSPLYGDCDDTTATIQPGVDDLCDGVDQDCDGEIDEDATFELWFADGDGDGQGRTANPSSTCDGAPPGFVATPGDCDDTDAGVQIPLWYRDADGDTWGTNETTSACTRPSGYASRARDCDDGRSAVNPGRAEVCDNDRDDDCDPETRCRYSGLIDVFDLEELQVPAGAEIAFVDDVVGSSAADVRLTRATRVEFYAGPDPDLMGSSTSRIEGAPSGTYRTHLVTPDSKFDVVWVTDSSLTVFAGGQTGIMTPSLEVVPGAASVQFPYNVYAEDGILWVSDLRIASNAGAVYGFEYRTGTLTPADADVVIAGTPGDLFGLVIAGADGLLAVTSAAGADGAVTLFEDPAAATTATDGHRIQHPTPGAMLRGAILGDYHPDPGLELACVVFNPDGFFSGGAVVIPATGGASLSAPLQTTFGLPQSFQVALPIADLDGDGVSDMISQGTGLDLDPLVAVPFLYGSDVPTRSFLEADFHVVNTDGDATPFAGVDVGHYDDDGRADVLFKTDGQGTVRYFLLRGRGE